MSSHHVNTKNTGISQDYGSYYNVETAHKANMDIDKEDHRSNNQCALVSCCHIIVVAFIPTYSIGSTLERRCACSAHISTLSFPHTISPGSRVLYVSRLHNYSKQLCYQGKIPVHACRQRGYVCRFSYLSL